MLSYIDMNQPWIYMYSPSRSPLSPPSLPFLFSISTSCLIFLSFLLLILNFVCYFSNTLKWYVKLFIWDFSCLLRKACITITFPLRTDFAASHRFCKVVLSFSCFSWYFIIYSLISSLIVISFCSFSTVLFTLHVLVLFLFFFLWLISSFILFWSEKMVEIISVLLNLLRFVLWPSVWPVLENITHMLEKNVCSVFLFVCCLFNFLEVLYYRYQLNPTSLLCHLEPPCLIDCLDDLPTDISEVLIYYYCIIIKFFLYVC